MQFNDVALEVTGIRRSSYGSRTGLRLRAKPRLVGKRLTGPLWQYPHTMHVIFSKLIRDNNLLDATGIRHLRGASKQDDNCHCMSEIRNLDKFRRLAESQEIVSVAILSKEDFATTFEKDLEEAETYRDGNCTYTTILETVIQASPSWLRNSSVSTAKESYSKKLTHLLKFLRLEVEGEQRVLLAKSGFKSNDNSRNKTEQGHRNEDVKTLPTSAALVSTGIFDVKDASRTVRPVIENIDKITEIIEVDQHVSGRSI
ncbi:hypothetical protein TNCV_409401 [Trichonephila clavipes]|nr:hypothetical protein TNCV_409401 [Trichonephila clavipes]